MKKEYKDLEYEIVRFDEEDVITASQDFGCEKDDAYDICDCDGAYDDGCECFSGYGK